MGTRPYRKLAHIFNIDFFIEKFFEVVTMENYAHELTNRMDDDASKAE